MLRSAVLRLARNFRPKCSKHFFSGETSTIEQRNFLKNNKLKCCTPPPFSKDYRILRYLSDSIKLRYLLLGGVLAGTVAVLINKPDGRQLDSFLIEDQVMQFRKDMQKCGKAIYSAIKIVTKDFQIKTIVFAQDIEQNVSQRVVDQLQQRLEILRNEIISMEIKYQNELENLEKENRLLRQQILIEDPYKKKSNKKIKKSLIDMYSEVLDELSSYDSSYAITDHLPRVIVVGDQSSGKTSVLESIAKARIFPRGSGQMMTTCPVKITLSEGPKHTAKFHDTNREFDLTKESDLSDLREEVEFRMRASIGGGKTVSSDVISMTVQGPGLRRMVLVDLPGIISTTTVEMADDTKDSIYEIAKHYMNNPNAIILCIQDGSLDAERSIVTDLVMQCDPMGKRTILVLTKVDLVEQLASPDRINKILSGKVFPMKALGYFAVVTGRGRSNDSIEAIREYEEDFFKNSKLFQCRGAIMPHQITSRNLSLAVSDRFWKMVRESVEEQAETFKAIRFNLESEWKHKFPKLREYSRDELFEKARGEILDEVVALSHLSAKKWEETITEKIWQKFLNYILENIYLNAIASHSFNTVADIKLRQWADQTLPAKSVEAGWETLQEEFINMLEKSKRMPDHDSIFDNLKAAVINEAIKRHTWEDRSIDLLRVIQLNALENRFVTDKSEWDQAVKLMEAVVKKKLNQTDEVLNAMLGPGIFTRVFKLKNVTEDQRKRRRVKGELEKVLQNDEKRSSNLTYDELTTIKNNLQREGFEVNLDYIRETWFPIYRKHFLSQGLRRVSECKKAFYLYTQQDSGCPVNCDDIVLFWRIQQVIKATSNVLRQQIVNTEARRLDKKIKDILDEFNDDDDKKSQLLTGNRISLAEKLIKVRNIQEKLEKFINSLNLELD